MSSEKKVSKFFDQFDGVEIAILILCVLAFLYIGAHIVRAVFIR